MNPKNVIPIAFATDENYVPFLSVAICSIVEHISKQYNYKFYVLTTNLSQKSKDRFKVYNTENTSVEFIDIGDKVNAIKASLPLRDYYTDAIFYRLFIPDLFPQYDKVLYLDCDMVCVRDIAELYNQELGDNVFGVVVEEVMSLVQSFSNYADNYLHVNCKKYFNSGLLLINCKKYKEIDVFGRFLSMLGKVKFTVAPDQDYLNVLCRDKVKYFDVGWNKMPTRKVDYPESELKIIHYKLFYKPWYYNDVVYEKYFWEYAKKTDFYEFLSGLKDGYDINKKAQDFYALKSLLRLANKTVEENKDNNILDKIKL